ncbi:hypothetical protein QOZ80_5AG0375690 [Eleusine coracana subsp. coracana]|nr:hypothetical protein QOZ80_5AG0375690 [Eleusine coracana subsp. coracana]
MELSPSSEPAGPWADPPEDIAIAIALSLRKEADVCTLGGSSRAWRIACDSDAVWECFFRRRWPAAAAEWAPRVQGWKAFYINQHKRIGIAISKVFFLFSKNHSTIINLIGLNYSIAYLHVPPSEVGKALQVRQVADRMVCVLVSPGRWFCHAWIPSETESSHKISLSELTVAEGSEVLDVLNRLVGREQPHRVRFMEMSNLK